LIFVGDLLLKCYLFGIFLFSLMKNDRTESKFKKELTKTVKIDYNQK